MNVCVLLVPEKGMEERVNEIGLAYGNVERKQRF